MIKQWWKVDDDDIVIYLESDKKIKGVNVNPMAEYFDGKKKTPYAVQYRVCLGSEEQENIFSMFEITDRDKIKETRQRMKTSE